MIPLSLVILAYLLFFIALWLAITIIVGVLAFSLVLIPAWLLLIIAVSRKTYNWRGNLCNRRKRNKAADEETTEPAEA